ncbi:hypothetical protein E8E13_006976 [Curvularia kusanoi]|uniref:F-box domain-containing protein n=1 Tax=Curvularia kusanoi TaxID=90978 RepID=A0A9P4W8M1_CURKU|nr:hypothetical protein E8E13_006976 [Curvularia kusanoi]
MATCTFADLPNDVLIMIITQLKTISDTTHDLSSCLKVNRRWRDATIPLLYGNIAFTRDNVSRFCDNLNVERYATCIRSITVKLEPGSVEAEIWYLARLLPQCTNLRSFSFCLRKEPRIAVPHLALVQLVEAKPLSCTNLELDTLGYDIRTGYDLQSKKDTPHLCTSLRAILPRMEHVRLRLRICAAVFSDDTRSVQLPKLKTLIVVCSCPYRQELPTCHITYLKPYYGIKFKLWPSIAASLTSLLATPLAVPADARVLALTDTNFAYNDLSLWPAYVLANFGAKKSDVIPFRHIWETGSTPESYVICLPHGTEMMGDPMDLEALAEGPLWCEVRGGARLPAAVLADARAERPSFAQGCIEAGTRHLKTSAEWRIENPEHLMSTWHNE